MNQDNGELQSASPTHAPGLKAWAKPVLRKLQIAATTGTGSFNQGVGKGKANSGAETTS
jgi:hypothetical protein